MRNNCDTNDGDDDAIILYDKIHKMMLIINPILHGWWLDNHALTLTNYTAKYYFGEKSKSLHTFLTFCPESRKIEFKLIKF